MIITNSPLSEFIYQQHATGPSGWVCVQQNCDGIHHYYVRSES